MDLNWLLIWMVGASCGLAILQRLRDRPIRWSKLFFPVLTSLVLVLTVFTAYSVAGYVSGTVWALTMVAPNILMTWVNALVARKKYGAAGVLARIVSVLNPFDGGWQLPKLVRAIQALDQENYETSLNLLNQIGQQQTAIGRMAVIMRTRRTGEWTEFLPFAEQWLQRSQPLSDPLMLDAYLQALGETGQRQRMLSEFSRLIVRHEQQLPPVFLNVTRAKAAAFAGDVPLANQILSVALNTFDAEFRDYWLGTAIQASGHRDDAAQVFSRLSDSQDLRMKAAAERRMATPVISLHDIPLTASDSEILNRISTEKFAEAEFAVLTQPPQGRLWASWAIAIVLVAVFVAEIPGGTEDLENLVSLGAMVIPTEVVGHEQWRIFAAAFLHYGIWHLLFNVSALLLLGRRLERSWGSVSTLVCYLLTAFGSIALAPVFMTDVSPYEPVVLVGASGGVMGIMGGLIAQSGFGLLRSRSKVVAREFQLLVSVVVIQMVFDSQTPNVSSLCHLLGLVIGLLYGVVTQSFQFWQTGRRHG